MIKINVANTSLLLSVELDNRVMIEDGKTLQHIVMSKAAAQVILGAYKTILAREMKSATLRFSQTIIVLHWYDADALKIVIVNQRDVSRFSVCLETTDHFGDFRTALESVLA